MSAAQLIQLSDLHLCADPAERLHGVDSRATLTTLLAQIGSHQPTDIPLLLTGDIAAHGELAAYQWLNQQLLETDRPVYWLPGNHDDPAAMQAGLGNFPRCHALTLGSWQLLLLDSSQPDSSAGYLAVAELDRLQHQLQASCADHLLLALHHPVAAIGSAWLDTMRVANAEQLAARLAGEPRLRGLLCGHVHQHSAVDWQGWPQLSAPASCFQFLPASRQFAVDAAAKPGYRAITLHPNGELSSQLVTV